jgi:hypothetical protein
MNTQVHKVFETIGVSMVRYIELGSTAPLILENL